MSRRYWLLILLLIIAIFIIYLSKSIKNTSSYENCVKMGGKIEYTDDSKYCGLNGGIYEYKAEINNYE